MIAENKQEQKINYHGNVSIIAKNGNAIIYKYNTHNAGTAQLFYGLCCLLTGRQSYKELVNYMPKSIKLFNRLPDAIDPSSYQYKALMDGAVYLSSPPELKVLDPGTNTNWCVVFHFTIPAYQIKTDEGPINYLALYGNDGELKLADISLQDGDVVDPQNFTTNTQYIVEWSLSFTNPTVENSTDD